MALVTERWPQLLRVMLSYLREEIYTQVPLRITDWDVFLVKLLHNLLTLEQVQIQFREQTSYKKNRDRSHAKLL